MQRYMSILGLLPTPRSGKTTDEKAESWMKRKEAGKVATPPLGLAINIFSSLAGSPANLSLKLEKEEAQQTIATSGLKCLELYESSSLHGLSLKMCVAYLLGTKVWYSSKCVLTWKAKATKSSRLLFQLAVSTPHTAGTEFGLLPTATTQEVEHPQAEIHQKTGRRIAKNGNTHSVGLADKIIMLKTPSASEGVGGWKVTDKYWTAKAPKLKMRDQVGRQTGLKLQPNFVEWMMGYPQNWTDLNSPSPLIGANDSKASATP